METEERLSIHIEDKNKVDAVDILPEYIFISIPQFDDKIRREIDKWLNVEVVLKGWTVLQQS